MIDPTDSVPLEAFARIVDRLNQRLAAAEVQLAEQADLIVSLDADVARLIDQRRRVIYKLGEVADLFLNDDQAERGL